MNEYGFDFDFEVENESTMMGKGMWLLINVFALTFSAMTTGAFFYTYVGDAFAFLFGAWSPYVTAFAGMTALDGLSRAWAHVRGHWSDTTDQMAVSRFMSWADLVASVIVTVVYLLLNAAFDVGIYTPIVVETIAEVEVVTGGDLTTLGLILNVVGVIILVAAIAGNFVAAHLFSDTSAGNREAVHKAEMSAMAATTRHRISKQQAIMTANHTMNEIMSVLPEHTRTKGADNRERYINSKFGDGTPRQNKPVQTIQYFTDKKPSIGERVSGWFGKGKETDAGISTPPPAPIDAGVDDGDDLETAVRVEEVRMDDDGQEIERIRRPDKKMVIHTNGNGNGASDPNG